MSSDTIRWGILATGGIAGVFAEALRESAGAEIVAVGSRSADGARRFADHHGIPHAHGSYTDLAADPDVDAIYIATPHAFHERDTILCLEDGKHVICEKPLAINAEQARRMIDAARAADRLLMEAMWTRFLPSTRRLVEIIVSGMIGEPRSFSADFRIAPPFDPTSRLFDPALGGGALLDLGVYAVSMAHHLFGPPEEVEGDAVIGPTGVDFTPDIQNSGSTADAVALFAPGANVLTDTPIDAVIYGGANTNGLIDETGLPGAVDVADAPAGYSIARTSLAGDWVVTDNIIPYDHYFSYECGGYVVGNEDSSWGSVKARYR